MEINEDVIKYYFKLNKDLIQCCQKANTDNQLLKKHYENLSLYFAEELKTLRHNINKC